MPSSTAVNRLLIIVSILILSIVGVLAQYSAGNGSFFIFAFTHLIKILVGFTILFLIYRIDINLVYSFVDILYGLCVLLLLFVSILGSIKLGAQRWLAIGPFALQPSEIMKIAIVMLLAKNFSKLPIDQIPKLRFHLVSLLEIFIPFVLIASQPDLGTACILLFIGFILLFSAGLYIRYFITLGAIVVLMIPLIWFNLYSYQKNRIITFLNPANDPLGSGYHIIQSKIAIGSGGVFGKGFLQGSQTQLNFIPEKQTDFVFALINEEFGFVGSLFLLSIYLIIILNCLSIARKCTPNSFEHYIIIGITTTFFLYLFINTGMVIGILPIVGVPLPFISYGGTSILSIMFGFGLILNIAQAIDDRKISK